MVVRKITRKNTPPTAAQSPHAKKTWILNRVMIKAKVEYRNALVCIHPGIGRFNETFEIT